MGCIWSKGVNQDEIVAEVISIHKESFRSLPKVVPNVESNPICNGSLARSLSKVQNNVPTVEGEKKSLAVVDETRRTNGHQRSVTADSWANGEVQSLQGGSADNDGERGLGIVDVPNGFSGEHVIAGWPSWLTLVAAEAIKGWLPRRADSFEKLDKIGQGTYSTVYRALDLETGKIVALKKVRFVNMDPESVRFMAREIHILRRLDHPNVIKLEGIVTSRISCNLYLVFEYMDHDLAGLASTPGIQFTEPQVKCFMQQLLSGLDHCHSRGVLHRDIKGSNLLVDRNGILRIGDFGLATVFNPEQKQTLTSRVVTLWYRPPELLLGATEYGVAVDLWSAGCILAELLVGKPIMPGRTEVEQLHKIFKLCGSPEEDYWKKSKLSQSTIFRPQHQYPRRIAATFRDFPSALNLLDTLLAIEPENRGTTVSSLNSEFFTTKPLACDPSSLPKYPPSKEYDAKLRLEEVRRQREAAVKGRGGEAVRMRYCQSKPVQDSMDLQKSQENNNRSSEKYNPLEDSRSGFPIEPPSGDHGYPRAGSTMHPGAYGNSRSKNMRDGEHRIVLTHSVSNLKTISNGPQLRMQRSYMPQYGDVGDLTSFTGLAASKTLSYNRLDVVEPSEKHHLLDRPASSYKQDNGGGKDSTMSYGNKNKRIHYSGPLMPPGGNIDDMLKEHERQIQQAVRKARLDKDKTKNF